MRIFATLLKPDAGHAEVAGFDVVRQANRLRAAIGLAGQYAAVDEYLTGFENLEMVGRLYHVPRGLCRRRADELLARFDLVETGGRPVKTYSGGMRRRLDLAASLVVSPPVLFLDEPTTGLDPRSRMAMWEIIAELVREGTTLLLTTQYLEEADQLADRIAVIDGGLVIAEGTADELKSRVGGDHLEIVIPKGGDLAAAAHALGPHLCAEPDVSPELRRVGGPIPGGAALLPEVVRALDAEGVALEDLSIRRPSLDDVFLALTGKKTGGDDQEKEAA